MIQEGLPLGPIAYTVPDYVSPSSIGTFQQCPLKFRFYKLDKLPTVSTEAQVIGSFVHEILEGLFEFEADARTLESARSLAKHLWAEKWEQEFNNLHIRSLENEFRWKVWWCVENYFELENPALVNLNGIEQPVNGLINDVPVYGIIDRWNIEDNKLVISDYKTGNKPSSRFEWEKKMQISIYGILLRDETGLDVKRSELYYLKSPKIVKYEFDRSTEEKVIDQITETWVNIKSSCSTGVFEAKKSKLCDWCDYRKICPAWK